MPLSATDVRPRSRTTYEIEDMYYSFLETKDFKAYTDQVAKLFKKHGSLSIADIKRLQGEDFRPRWIFDCLENIDGLLEVAICPSRWRIR